MEVDQIIAAVKKETGIKLNTADPVLASASINAVLLDEALGQMDHSMTLAIAKFAAFGEANAETVRQNQEAAKLVASSVVNGAAEFLVERFKEATHEATSIMLAELRQETAKAEAAVKKARLYATWSGAIGAGALALILGYGLAGI